MSRIGVSEPEEVAECIAYVASDTARYMIGSIISIDGGLVTYGGGFPKPPTTSSTPTSPVGAD
jgi:hypothetical protein